MSTGKSASAEVTKTKKWIEAYLGKRLIARLATKGRDGFPQVTPVWFIWEKGRMYICTNKDTVKVKNIRADPRVAVLLDSAVQSLHVWGVQLRGEASFLSPRKSLEFNHRIHEKYLGKETLSDPKVRSYFSRDDITIVVRPNSSFSWDTRKLSIAKNKGLPTEL